MRATTATAFLGLAATSQAVATCSLAQPPAITPAPSTILARDEREEYTGPAPPECFESYMKLQYEVYSNSAIHPTMADDLASWRYASGPDNLQPPATQLVRRDDDGDAYPTDKSQLWEEKVAFCSTLVSPLTVPSSIASAYASYYSTWRAFLSSYIPEMRELATRCAVDSNLAGNLLLKAHTDFDSCTSAYRVKGYGEQIYLTATTTAAGTSVQATGSEQTQSGQTESTSTSSAGGPRETGWAAVGMAVVGVAGAMAAL